MKIFVVVLLFISALGAGQKIPVQECLQAKYGHTMGGTMHAKAVLSQRLLNKIRKSLNQDDAKALLRIQKKYPDLSITTNALIIRNCEALYKSTSTDKYYFFDPETLRLLNKKEN